MPDHAPHQLLGLLDRGAVCRVIAHIIPGHQLFEARHVIAHVAIGRDDDAGRPAHHVIAGEQRAAFLQREAQVVRGVPRRRDGFERPAVAADALAVSQDTVGGVERVEARLRGNLGTERRGADDRCAGQRL